MQYIIYRKRPGEWVLFRTSQDNVSLLCCLETDERSVTGAKDTSKNTIEFMCSFYNYLSL